MLKDCGYIFIICSIGLNVFFFNIFEVHVIDEISFCVLAMLKQSSSINNGNGNIYACPNFTNCKTKLILVNKSNYILFLKRKEWSITDFSQHDLFQ